MESVRQVSPQDLIGWIDHSVSFLPFCAEKIKDLWFFCWWNLRAKKYSKKCEKKNREKARIGVSKSAKENLSRPANYFRHDCNKKKTNQPALVAKRQRMIWSPWTAARKKAIIFFIIIRCYSSLRCKHFFFRRISRRIYALRLFGFACLGKARFKIDVCAHKPVPKIGKAAKTALVARVMPVVTSSALENRRE